MPPRPMSRIVDEIADEYGKQSKLGRKLRTNRERNWMLALVLNTYAKVADGVPTNDLDAIVLAAFDRAGWGERMREHGRHYTKLTPQVREELFPGAFGTLGEHADYTLEDLRRDLPDLDAAALAMPNAVDIDVAGVHDGTAYLSDFPRPSRDTRRRYASELIRAVEPDNPRLATSLAAADRYSIKATRFHCTDETGTDFLGSDEPYWIFGSLGDGVSVTTRSHVFDDIDSGDDATFGTGEGWIWGQGNRPQVLPPGDIGTMIQLWEHDAGDTDDVKSAVAAAFATAGGILTATGAAAWIAGVTTAVGAVVTWLLGVLDDDHIGDQTFVFSRQTILSQAAKLGQSFDVTLQFTDGDGDYTLTVTVTNEGPPPTTTTVPDVRESRVGLAVSEVIAAGLTPHVTGATGVSAWVFSQSPRAGTVVDVGSTVNMVGKTGPIP
jgi:hypothetical protein